jgi:hypothetical protein
MPAGRANVIPRVYKEKTAGRTRLRLMTTSNDSSRYYTAHRGGAFKTKVVVVFNLAFMIRASFQKEI